MKRDNRRSCTVVVAVEGLLDHVKVTAQYYRIVDGVLYFRNYTGAGTYPETVRVFAPGYWQEIIPDAK